SCGWTGTVNDAQIAHQQNPVHERNRKIAAECRRLGIQHAVRTRVDLMEIPAIANLGADSCGQPLAYENTYNCEDCDVSWTDHWSCGVDTPCPCCGQDTAPEDMQLRISTLLTPLFEMLPEIAAEEALT
uniref:hypothetical protein n=1 Tax=uncultured Tateyamaria sp. TaxID=455651 RepID=UPI0026022E95